MSRPQPFADGARREQIGTTLIAAVGLVIGLGWLVLMLARFRHGGIIDDTGAFNFEQLWGYDFGAYMEAASRLSSTGSLYQAETLGGVYNPGPAGLYLYAPFLGVVLTPLLAVAPLDSVDVWFVGRVVALIAACALMPVKPVVRVFAFVTAALSLAVVEDLILGNVSVLLLLPLVVAWRWLDRPLGSVAQAVAISIRPMLGILLIWQLLRRQWAAVAWTIGAGLVLVALTLPFVGVSGYLDYLTVLANAAGFTGAHENRDLGSTVLRLGASDTLATVALLAGYAIAIGAIALSLRRDREVGFIVAATASLLLSPLMWDHYLTMLVLPGAFLAERMRPVFIVLPLAAWLPASLLPLVVVAAVVLPLLVRDPVPASAGAPTAAGMEPQRV